MIGLLTAPAGNSMVRPVSGMAMTPPDVPMVFETLTFLWSFSHQTALSSRFPASLRLPLIPELPLEPELSEAVASEGAVGLCRMPSEHEAMRSSPTNEAKDRNSLMRNIDVRWVEGGLGGPPKATDVPDPNSLNLQYLDF
jgi:hypothetical protein